MKTALIAVLLLQAEPSEAARKARTELDAIRSNIEKLMKFREREQKLQEQFRAGSEDEERLKKLAKQREDMIKEFQEIRDATIKAMDALLLSSTEALKQAPDDPGLLEVRSEAYLMYKKDDLALQDLEKVAKSRPEDADVALKLGRLQHQLNRYDAAVPNFAKYLKKDPKHVESRVMLATCDFALHNFEESGRRFDEVLKEELDPQQRDHAQRFQKMAGTYVPLWKAEQEIRAKEGTADDLPRVKFTTSKGEIEIELLENEAPNTVANFIELIGKKFYDGLKFHRVIPGFMAQGGCPRGDGSGDAGYRFKDEVKGEYRRHFRGSLSMANSGPDTNGSQFFITHLPTEWLNGRHTVFGRVLKGQVVVDSLQGGDTIVKAEVMRKREHEYRVVRIEGAKPSEEK